jgi:Fe-S-cluster-containing dehydrogenase component
MDIDRRSVLKMFAGGGALAVGAGRPAAGQDRKEAPEGALGLLYDSTLCIGCQACVDACRRANDVPYSDAQALYYDNDRLSANTKNIIKKYEAPDGRVAFMKMQCMHCLDPACASACMLGSFKKRLGGAITWDPDKCVGCRYCQVACPFGVPQFEWGTAVPHLVKCELCTHLVADGGTPACADVCPREAVIFGRYTDLLAEAHRRLEAEPERYEPKVYGEFDGGGTQVLYLSARGVPFTALGLPDLGEESVPHIPETLQHTLYKGFVAPVALYGVLGLTVWRNRRELMKDDYEIQLAEQMKKRHRESQEGSGGRGPHREDRS